MTMIALLGWPVLVFILFRTLPFRDALIWSILGGYLLLPSASQVSIDLPLLPALDKRLVPSVAAALMAIYTLKAQANEQRLRRDSNTVPEADVQVLKGWLPRSKLGLILLAIIPVGMVMTALTNGDPQVFGPLRLPGQTLRDAFSNMLVTGVALLPLLLGRKFLSDEEGHKRLMVILFISALIYTLPALFETRMSPQVNRMVYGFFPHSWLQHIRDGGWRPLVFLDHGLLLGIYFACALIAGTILVRISESGKRLTYIFCVVWLLGALVMAKTLGALLIAVALLPVAFMLPVRLQLMAAAIIAMITIVYPMLRGSGFVPTDAIVEAAGGEASERAGSLAFRFGNEDALLGRANERPVFGWGWWQRARVFDENGVDTTVTDGAWIIIMSETGWVGYLSQFGLLTVPIMLFFFRRKRYQIGLVTSGLCLVTSANLIDLLPNASLSPVLWLAAGALLGRLEFVPQEAAKAADTHEAAPEAEPALDPDLELTRYSRFPVRKGREV